MQPNKGELLYEGKAKKLFSTDDPGLVIMEFKDDLTAFDAAKRGQFAGKGETNNRISAYMMQQLAEQGVSTCFIQLLDATHSLCHRVEILKLEVIVRFEAHGSLCKRFGIPAGLSIEPPLVEMCLKDDSLHDPFLTDDVALLMSLATREELALLRRRALEIGAKLQELYAEVGVKLLDFKLEFGRLADGEIVLADEVTPDTCRLVDAQTGEKLDKDLFRFDLGDVGAGYAKLLARLPNNPAGEASG